ncbi:hypothetical protein GCM10007863_07640 [Dyella mobilis]|nr:hypothetical protein GCM10007863_07640 [Dyella mobilis]
MGNVANTFAVIGHAGWGNRYIRETPTSTRTAGPAWHTPDGVRGLPRVKAKTVAQPNTNAEGESFVELRTPECLVRLPGDPHSGALGNAHYSEPPVTKVKFMTYDTCFFRTAV